MPRSQLGEFWVPNPWAFPQHGKNLSSYERNRVFLNRGSLQFADISSLTGADSDGDARCAVAADLNGDGMLDLVVRQVGGGSLLVFENRFPRQHYLEVSLRGNPSNRTGIGSRLVATVNGRSQTRELYPANTYKSQAPCSVHFGLGGSDVVERLVIHWPSGTVQELKNVSADQHVIVEESKDVVQAFTARSN
ncbi:MAG: CRTAC1 family protein [Planctomycetes bacterium]|nr:CRTAC1 family protein [Planctomycetota bacterium]